MARDGRAGRPSVGRAARGRGGREARDEARAIPATGGGPLTRAEVEALLAAGAAGAALDLRGADLRGADLRGMALDGARLERADLGGADLTGAGLEAADLRAAILTSACLEDCDLSGAHLEGASLQRARLARAHLAHAHLDGARLRGARLDEATLWGARLRGAELDGARFAGADLQEAELDGAFFAGCALADADLAAIRWEGLRAGEELEAARAAPGERAEAWRAAADAYRRLRQACAAQGLYERAGELYRREMRMRQRALGCEALLALWRVPALRALARGGAVVGLMAAAPPLWLLRALARPLHPLAAPGWRAAGALARWGRAAARPWRSLVRWAWHAALDLLCGYGERVGRVVVAAVVVMVGMALVYLRLGQLTEADGRAVTSFWHALYFSACSFSSIGYAAFAPNAHGLAKWLGVGESLSGNFLLALFLVTFTRKLTR